MARPRKKDAIDIKGRAIEEASALLRDAPDTLSLASLAKRIGCSAPALYAHFENKNDLLNQVRERAFVEMVDVRRNTFDRQKDDPIAAIRDAGHRLVDFANERPAIYRLVFFPEHDASERQIALMEEAVFPLAETLREIRKGDSRDLPDADDTARTIWFAIHGAILSALDRQLPGEDDENWARAHRTVDTMIRVFVGPD